MLVTGCPGSHPANGGGPDIGININNTKDYREIIVSPICRFFATENRSGYFKI